MYGFVFLIWVMKVHQYAQKSFVDMLLGLYCVLPFVSLVKKELNSFI